MSEFGSELVGFSRSKTARLIGLVVVVVALAFLISQAAAGWEQIQPAIADLRVEEAIIAGLAILAAECVFLVAWRAIILMTGETLAPRQAFRAYALSGVGRFLPGAIMAHVGRAGLVMRYGVAPRPAALSVATETILSASAALTLAVVASVDVFGVVPGATARWTLVFVALATLSGVTPSLIARAVSIPVTITKRRTLLLISTYAAAWLLLGSALRLVTAAFTSHNTALPSFLAFAGGMAGAWLIGMLAVVVPGGIGVREAALGTLLGSVVDPGLAVVIAISHRLLWWLVTAILFGLGQALGDGPQFQGPVPRQEVRDPYDDFEPDAQ